MLFLHYGYDALPGWANVYPADTYPLHKPTADIYFLRQLIRVTEGQTGYFSASDSFHITILSNPPIAITVPTTIAKMTSP